MEEKKYTKDDIERLRKLRDEDPSQLKPDEARYANLHPIEKGEVRNPKGRGKGVKNWSTHFKRLMGDEKFLKSIVKSLPSQWTDTVDEVPASVIAAGLIATATQNVARAVAEGRPVDEQTLKIIDRIEKIGYGEKVVHGVDEEQGFFEKVEFNFITHPGKKQEEKSENS